MRPHVKETGEKMDFHFLHPYRNSSGFENHAPEVGSQSPEVRGKARSLGLAFRTGDSQFDLPVPTPDLSIQIGSSSIEPETTSISNVFGWDLCPTLSH